MDDDPLDPRLPPCEDSLVLRGAAELARNIAAGEISSREVVSAFLDRIAAVDDQLNAICWPLFDQARTAAAAADQTQAQGQTLGPLHGVPITIKECFHIAGTPSTMGLSAYKDHLQPNDSSLVASLKAAGAIVLGKTNVPQLMILHETDNPLYGRTNNPRNLDCTPGGSSGGEGAIIAAHGSPCGLGSDLGGSIRIPAHFCGVAGLKPTTFRLTKQGTIENLRGLDALQFQPGPLAARVEDLDLMMRVLTSGQQWHTDCEVTPAPWPDVSQVSVGKLRIGVIKNDQYAPPAEPIAQAVERATDALTACGAQVEEIDPPDVQMGMALYFALAGADGAGDLKRLVKGSEVDPRVASILRLGGTSRWLRPAMARGLRTQGKRQLADIVAAAGPRSADSYWKINYKAKTYVREYLTSLAERGIDAIICPPHARSAFAHREGKPDSLISASYAFMMNLLGIPCGVVPYGWMPPENNCRLPVGVQVAAGYWREDIVLAVMQVLEQSRQS